ncbi:hypothetical protein NP233_g9293 [Leucocoprinus birnbaumii]|uniref:PhoD-like phosphatase domain-containing protein n=1 Tax=Leucocoprinus birnbaumii TaxID=56174 RepID=A0AAD5YQZ8_9AGAR|nr:hypothetical protein NP233_g9293 [Leucocoprinus birnbaumii]
MDNPGWRANRRAQKENEYYTAKKGHYGPVEEAGPIEESFIGGFYGHRPPPSPSSPVPPPIPPKDGLLYPVQPPSHAAHQPPIDGMPMPSTHNEAAHLQPPGPSQSAINQPAFPSHALHAITTEQLTHLTAVERSQMLRFMCGPLLKFDTIDSQRTWFGAALIVTADAGSIYEPHPKFSYEWDSDKLTPSTLREKPNGNNGAYSASVQSASSKSQNGNGHLSFDLGPHPADPHSTALPGSPMSTSVSASSMADTPGPNARREDSYGQDIWVYAGTGGTFTFWRFMIKIPLADHEMEVTYRINNGQAMNFYVPGRNQNMRWAAHSCNGFSSGINPDDFRGPGFQTGYDPLWVDLLSHHAETPFHALAGGGDQLYCDPLTREPELQGWVSKMKPEERKQYPLTDEIKACVDRFLFNHYCQAFRRGAFARANSSIPMLNMLDDHDLIDGFGSYPDDMQQAPVFRQWVLSFFTVNNLLKKYTALVLEATSFSYSSNVSSIDFPADVDGVSDAPGKHPYRSLVLGQVGPYIRLPSHSFLVNMGPQTAMLLLDCRAERRKDQVCSPFEYDKVFQQIRNLPPTVEHLTVMLGIPIAYPRMVFLESALESKLNPLVALGRSGSLGLSGFVNKFNAEAELLDDLNDHWTARTHKQERNWLIEQMQKIAAAQRLRITFVSGDVHCAAVGVLKTHKAGKKEPEVPIGLDHRYMLNVVTSAIVNTPPPGGVLTMVNSLATKTHKTLHHADTDEIMMPLFAKDTDGSSRRQKYVMGRRNWCSVNWDRNTGNMNYSLQIERQKGNGVTMAYPTFTPPPGWARA